MRKAGWQGILRRQLKLPLPAKPGFVSPGGGPEIALLSDIVPDQALRDSNK